MGISAPRDPKGNQRPSSAAQREGVSIGNLRLSKSSFSQHLIWPSKKSNDFALLCRVLLSCVANSGVSVCNCNLYTFDRAILLSICRESCEHSGSFRPCVCFMLARPPGRGCKKCPPHHQAWARWSLDETRSDVSCHWNLLRSSDHLSPFRPLWNTLVVLPGSHMLPTVFHVGDQLIVSPSCVSVHIRMHGQGDTLTWLRQEAAELECRALVQSASQQEEMSYQST